MYFTFNNYTIGIKEYETKHQMLSVLENCKLGSILLGNAYEYEKEYYVIKIYTSQNYNDFFCIGILSEGHGLKPHILLRQISNEMFIGFNNEVASINCFDKKVNYIIKLNSLFHSFAESNKHSTILIFHEVGVLAIGLNGEEKWRYDDEIIDNYIVQVDFIDVTFWEKGDVSLSIIDGSAMK